MRARSSPAARSVYVMTRIESTSSPRSQTERQKRSTMTVVLPVPAPAETKTTPGLLDRPLLLEVRRVLHRAHVRFTRHIGQRSHQVGHGNPPFGSWRTSPERIRSTTACAWPLARSTWPQNASSSR